MDNKMINQNITDNIPEKLMKSFTKRAIRDAQKIVDINDPKFNDIAYAIFRGYNLGFSLGVLKKVTDEIEINN
jgi:hypothetical protein